MVTDKQKFTQILKLLDEAKRSEDYRDYVDGDGEGWGPAMGAAANRAKEHNKEVDKLKKFLRAHIKGMP